MSQTQPLLKDITREQANLLLSATHLRISRLNAGSECVMSFAEELLTHLPEIYQGCSSEEIIKTLYRDIDRFCFALNDAYKMPEQKREYYKKAHDQLVKKYKACECPTVGAVLSYSRAQCFEFFAMACMCISQINMLEGRVTIEKGQRTYKERIINPFDHSTAFFTLIVYKAQENADRIRQLVASDVSKGIFGLEPYLIFSYDEEFGSIEDIHERLELYFPLSQIVNKDGNFYYDPSIYPVAENSV